MRKVKTLNDTVLRRAGNILFSSTRNATVKPYPVRICFVIDRMEGARENVEAAGFEFDALLNKDDLGI